MPLVSYEGNTFVAFIDISGFKELMRNENEAWRALDRLYNTGYLILGVHSYEANKVNGLFVSDSGVLFVRRKNLRSPNTVESLSALLSVVKGINERMINSVIQRRCGISVNTDFSERSFMLEISIAL